MSILMFFVIWMSSASAKSQEAMSGAEEIIVNNNWGGADKLLQYIQGTHSDPCEFIHKTEKKYSDTEYILSRLFKTAAKTKCAENSSLVKKYLKSSDPLIQASAVNLAASLPSDQRAEFKVDISKLRSTSKDFALKKALAEYPKDEGVSK